MVRLRGRRANLRSTLCLGKEALEIWTEESLKSPEEKGERQPRGSEGKGAGLFLQRSLLSLEEGRGRTSHSSFLSRKRVFPQESSPKDGDIHNPSFTSSCVQSQWLSNCVPVRIMAGEKRSRPFASDPARPPSACLTSTKRDSFERHPLFPPFFTPAPRPGEVHKTQFGRREGVGAVK